MQEILSIIKLNIYNILRLRFIFHIILWKNLYFVFSLLEFKIYRVNHPKRSLRYKKTIKERVTKVGVSYNLDKIDFTKLIKNPKWIIGYSDVTVLHSHLHQLAVPTLHSTMPINFKDNTAESLDSLRKVLIGETLNYEIDSNINNIQM